MAAHPSVCRPLGPWNSFPAGNSPPKPRNSRESPAPPVSPTLPDLRIHLPGMPATSLLGIAIFPRSLSSMSDLQSILAGGALPPECRNVDQLRIQRAVREILLAVGEDPDRDGLRETPERVARMYAEIFGGLHVEPGRHLQKVFEEQYDELVLVRDISFNSMCEHHLLPFMGKAHIGYIPRGRVTGLSKLARVVDEVARRPQVQERMTHTIADLIENELSALGVIVVIEAEHTCMTIRGVKKPGALTITSAVRGQLRNNLGSRAEAMALINGK
ncbi:MAG: cyclohydrolase 1 [Planctomycetota bacterium]